jgi:Xaa-Pro aminopeptidase
MLWNMKTRIKKLQKLMAKKKLSALLVSNPYNVRYLSGFVGTNGSLLVTPKQATLITDARYFVTAKKAGIAFYDQQRGLKGLMRKLKVVGFEDSEMTVAKLKAYKKVLPTALFKPASGLVESMRAIKDEEEIKIIKMAVKIARESLRRLEKLIKPGMSEGDLEWELLRIVHELGADGFSFPPIVTFGKDTADIHHQKGPNKLKKGEMVLIDFGAVFQGYITDMTRVFLSKEASKFEHKIYTTVLEANLEAIKAVKVGAKFSDIDKAARMVIEKAGFGKYFTHSTGHGTGLEVHEAPHVSVRSEEVVKPGMVFTIEPGIYIEGKGGVRIEDMVYVNLDGSTEVLT